MSMNILHNETDQAYADRRNTSEITRLPSHHEDLSLHELHQHNIPTG